MNQEGNKKDIKIISYERFYIHVCWYTVLLCFISVFADNYLLTKNTEIVSILKGLIYCLFLVTFNFVKYYLVEKELFLNKKIYYAIRFAEVAIIIVGVRFFDIGSWFYITVIFSILITTICKGFKIGIYISSYTYFFIFVYWILKYIFNNSSIQDVTKSFIFANFVKGTFYYVILILFCILYGRIHDDNKSKEEERDNLIAELEQKYNQLEIAQDEIKFHYEKLKQTNSMLEESNKKLTDSVAEFYTLQQITQAISSIFDINELLKYVNDIILGVMGVNFSTIILYDEKKAKFKCHTTNIKDKNDLAVLTDNINSDIFLEVLNESKSIIENFVDPDIYTFTINREVNSLICVPLYTKSRRYGIVLIEHKHYNAFDDENVRLLDIIGQQVSITVENAQLYQQMQEMATIDGLTQIYNRLYFQDTLFKELESAKKQDYEISLIIFDIDHFKRFNDTFGHLFGDEVLKTIANLVKFSLRKEDVFARYGGEEFIILLPRTGLSSAYEKAEELRQLISRTKVKDKLVSASVTVSMGVSSFPISATSDHELLKTADDALYEAKTAGRNCVKVIKV